MLLKPLEVLTKLRKDKKLCQLYFLLNLDHLFLIIDYKKIGQIKRKRVVYESYIQYRKRFHKIQEKY